MRFSSCVPALFLSAVFAIFSSSTASASLADSLVASYLFNGNANDASGHDNHGSVQGAVLATGHTGISNSAYFFDGIDDCIVVPDSPSLDMPGQMSISLWIKLSMIPVRDMLLIGKSNYVSHTNYLIRAVPGDILRWEYNAYYDATIPSLQVETWYHIVVTAESPVGAKQIYINGELQAFASSTSGTHGLVDAPLTMGRASYGSESLSGTLDNVQIWNRVLTSEEVAYLYQADFDVPVVQVSPDGLFFSALSGGPNPPPQAIAIINVGEDSLYYQASTTASWFSVEPGSGGPVPPTAFATVSVDIAGLAPGTYQDLVVVVEGENGNSDTAQVTLTIIDANMGSSIKDGLVACYSFKGNARDYSGFDNDGIVQGATLAPGHASAPDHALDFNGVDNSVTVPDSPSLDMPGPMSISLWVKLSEIPTQQMTLVGKTDHMEHTNYLLEFYPGNILRWEYNTYCDAAIPSLQAGAWYHVVVTAESPIGAQHIYVNGESQTAVVYGGGAHGLIYQPMTLGYRYIPGWTGWSYLNGMLDDVRIWNRALSAEEVAFLYLTDDSYPVLSLSADTLTFEAQLYGENPPPQTVDIANIGGDALSFTAIGTKSWLDAQPENGGPVPPEASVSIGVNAAPVPAGVHHGQVLIAAAGAMLSPDTLDVVLMVHDPRVGLMGKDAVIRFAYEGSGWGDSIPCVIGPAPEYYTYEDGDVFKVETAVDINDDIITAAHNVWYTGYGGGTVYGMYIWISGLNMAACGPIAGVEILGVEGASLYEYGPDHVILHVAGGCGGWSCGEEGPFLNHIAVRLVATQCGICCDADGNCTLCTQAECDAPGVWHEDKIECASGLCAVSSTLPPAIGVEGLQGAAPCPFGTRSTLSFTLAQRRRISLDIFDVAGRKVRSLQMGDYGPGTHTVDWDGKDTNGRSVVSGVYYARLLAGNRVWSKAIIVVR